jgi:hypothetical protein
MDSRIAARDAMVFVEIQPKLCMLSSIQPPKYVALIAVSCIVSKKSINSKLGSETTGRAANEGLIVGR